MAVKHDPANFLARLASPSGTGGPPTLPRRGFRPRPGGAPVASGKLRPSGYRSSTEERYAIELNRRMQIGEVVWWRYEAIKLRLADATFYSPDFAVQLADGELQLHEVKGFWQDAARVKTKVVAELFPLRIVIVTARAKRDGGGFKLEEL